VTLEADSKEAKKDAHSLTWGQWGWSTQELCLASFCPKVGINKNNASKQRGKQTLFMNFEGC
jgi:hypothetical protein